MLCDRQWEESVRGVSLVTRAYGKVRLRSLALLHLDPQSPMHGAS